MQFNTYKNVLENATFAPYNDTIINDNIEKEKVYMKPMPQIAIENENDEL